MSDIKAVKDKISAVKGGLAEADGITVTVEDRRMKVIQTACRALALLGEVSELLVVNDADGRELTEAMMASSRDAEGVYSGVALDIGQLCVGSENLALENASASAATAGRSMFSEDVDSDPSVHRTANEIGLQWQAAGSAVSSAQSALKVMLQYAGAMHATLEDARMSSLESSLSLDGYTRQITDLQ